MNTILRSIGLAPYQSHSYHATYNAQRNLTGRTHYVDSDTLRSFRAKITRTGTADEGLVFWLVESVRSKPSEISGGTFRFVAFDVVGSVLDGTRDKWHRSTEAAYKAGMAWLSTFDAQAHTRQLLSDRAAALRREADQIDSALGA